VRHSAVVFAMGLVVVSNKVSNFLDAWTPTNGYLYYTKTSSERPI